MGCDKTNRRQIHERLTGVSEPMSCNRICKKYKASLPNGNHGISGGHYVNGHKRCQMCDIYIKWDGDGDDPLVFVGKKYDPTGRNCPCCNYRLRTKPRSSYYKKILRAKKGKIDQLP